MRKRRVYLVLIAIAVLVGVLAVIFRPEREPEYGGRKLSEWVEQHYTEISRPRYSDPTMTFYVENEEATDAIRELGTNALPSLLKWISYEPRRWKLRLYDIVNPAIRRLNRAWYLTDEQNDRKADGAEWALLALGPRAAGAIPELTALLNTREARESALRVIKVLSELAGRPVLDFNIIGSSPLVKLVLAGPRAPGSGNWNLDPKTKRALTHTFLQHLLTNADWNVRREATNALEKTKRLGQNGDPRE